MVKPGDHKRFKRSKPWGYLPTEVDKAMDQYENTIAQLNNKLMDVMQALAQYKDRCKSLEDELRAMHIEMSSLELPDTEEVVESVVLNDFRAYPGEHAMPRPGMQHMPEEGVVNIPVGDDQRFSKGSVAGESVSMLGKYEEDALNDAFDINEEDDEEPVTKQNQQYQQRQPQAQQVQPLQRQPLEQKLQQQESARSRFKLGKFFGIGNNDGSEEQTADGGDDDGDDGGFTIVS